MFIVFNKEKIYSYIVALSTIVVLFMIANIVIDRNQDLVQASSTEKLLPIYSVEFNLILLVIFFIFNIEKNL